GGVFSKEPLHVHAQVDGVGRDAAEMNARSHAEANLKFSQAVPPVANRHAPMEQPAANATRASPTTRRARGRPDERRNRASTCAVFLPCSGTPTPCLILSPNPPLNRLPRRRPSMRKRCAC